ncbi:hypothetical protein ACFUIY_01990 [Streptomyces griseorubiginosus]|uniref:hypothetical protein n=1 Tax=Streptomyces griseorubiginosus TaxID=67304 RepID=UPI0036413CD0
MVPVARWLREGDGPVDVGAVGHDLRDEADAMRLGGRELTETSKLGRSHIHDEYRATIDNLYDGGQQAPAGSGNQVVDLLA